MKIEKKQQNFHHIRCTAIDLSSLEDSMLNMTFLSFFSHRAVTLPMWKKLHGL
jgi:hypothetical protein